MEKKSFTQYDSKLVEQKNTWDFMLKIFLSLLFFTCFTLEATQEQDRLIVEICSLANKAIGVETSHVFFTPQQREDLPKFLERLGTHGFAEKEGKDVDCRAVCVTAQAGLEVALEQMLRSGRISELQVIILTPLPCTPLRNEAKEIDFSVTLTSTQYTVEKRANTVRDMRAAGATIIAAYSRQKYEELKAQENPKFKKEVEVYEKEKSHPNVIDMPLSSLVPAHLVGALYLIKDRSGNNYILATQGIQVQDAAPGIEKWAKWLSVQGTNESTDLRAQEMVDFISQNDGAVIQF